MSSARVQSHSGIMSAVLTTMAAKEGDYKEGTLDNHAQLKVEADRLTANGEFEETLLDMADEESKNQIQTFLQEQRDRTKALSERNQLRIQTIDHFIGAIQKLKADLNNNNDDADGTNAHGGGELYGNGQTDYEAKIADLMKQQAAEYQKDPKDSDMYKDICEALGEKVHRGGRGGNKKNNNDDDDDDDDDDDIEVMRNHNQGNIDAQLKCPFTATWMEDPVKNKQCGHVYSRLGIMDYLKKKANKQCPFPGCTNNSIRADQLEDDVYTKNKVRQRIRRLQKEEEAKVMSQAALDMDDDDDDEAEEM